MRYDVENNDTFYNRTNESYGGYHKKSVEYRLSDIDVNGLNAFQRAAKKMVDTRRLKNSYQTAKVKEHQTKKEKMVEISNKISETLRGSCWVNKNGEKKYLKSDEIEAYLNDGWKFGLTEYTLDECKYIAEKNNISTNIEWKEFAKNKSLPTHPNRTFKSDWVSWEDFLNKKSSRGYIYKDCVEFVKEFKIKTKKDWYEYASKYKLPYHPNRKFKNEWNGWGEFLNG